MTCCLFFPVTVEQKVLRQSSSFWLESSAGGEKTSKKDCLIFVIFILLFLIVSFFGFKGVAGGISVNIANLMPKIRDFFGNNKSNVYVKEREIIFCTFSKKIFCFQLGTKHHIFSHSEREKKSPISFISWLNRAGNKFSSFLDEKLWKLFTLSKPADYCGKMVALRSRRRILPHYATIETCRSVRNETHNVLLFSLKIFTISKIMKLFNEISLHKMNWIFS